MGDAGLRRWTSAIAGVLLVGTVLLLVGRSENDRAVMEIQDLHTKALETLKTKNGNADVQALQKKVFELMQEVRNAGKDAASNAKQRDMLSMQLAEDGDSGSTPVKVAELRDHIREEISSENGNLKTAEQKRKELQKKLDKAVNELAKAQLKAFDLKASAKPQDPFSLASLKHSQPMHKIVESKEAVPTSKSTDDHEKSAERIATLEHRVQALKSALEALKKLKNSASSSGTEGQLYLAELGQKLISMPEVQKLLIQSLSAKDLKIAEEIAKSLGKNFTSNAPVDPKIMAQVAIAAAEQEAGVPLQDDGKTPLVNASDLLPPVSPELAAEAGQAGKEVEIEKKYMSSDR